MNKVDGLMYLLLASVINGAFPLLTLLSGAKGSPLLYTLFLAIGGSISITTYLLLRHPYVFQKSAGTHQIWKFLHLKKTGLKRPPLFVFFGENSILLRFRFFGSVFYTWSTFYLQDQIAAIIIGTSPIFFIFVADKILGQDYQYKKKSIMFVPISIFGVVLVVLSDISSNGNASSIIKSIFGVVLVFSSMMLGLQSISQIKQVNKFTLKEIAENSDTHAASIKYSNTNNHEMEHKKIGHIMFGRLLTLLLPIPIVLVIFGMFKFFGIFQNFAGGISFNGIIISIIGGAIIPFLGDMFHAKGTLKARRLEAHGIRYLTPFFSVSAIIIYNSITNGFGNIAVNWNLFIIGFFVIITSNVLANISKTKIG